MRQRLHWPQPAWISTVTRSPMANSSTPGPSAATVPMYSWPGVQFLLNGRPPWISAGGPCAMTSRSVAQIATASMRTSTSARARHRHRLLGEDAARPGSPSTQARILSGTGMLESVLTPGGAYMASQPLSRFAPNDAVILGLVPRIQPSANAGASRWMDGRDKPDHDKPDAH